MKKELFLIRGLPGSGKTTFAKKMAKRFILKDYPVLEADSFFIKDNKYVFNESELTSAHRWCAGRCVYHMERNVGKIFISNTFTKEWEMGNYIRLAKIYGYNVTTIIVENRHGGTNVHGVPEEKLKIMRDRFQIKL